MFKRKDYILVDYPYLSKPLEDTSVFEKLHFKDPSKWCSNWFKPNQ